MTILLSMIHLPSTWVLIWNKECSPGLGQKWKCYTIGQIRPYMVAEGYWHLNIGFLENKKRHFLSGYCRAIYMPLIYVDDPSEMGLLHLTMWLPHLHEKKCINHWLPNTSFILPNPSIYVLAPCTTLLLSVTSCRSKCLMSWPGTIFPTF